MIKQDLSVVDSIIKLSRLILALKLFKLHLIRGKEIYNEIGIVLFYMRDHVNDQINEVDIKIKELGSKVQFLLQPLFQGKNFGFDGFEIWSITAEDMTKGYVILEEIVINGNSEGQSSKYVLFLSDHKDKKFNIKQGSLLPFSEVVSILGNQKNVLGNLPKVNSYLKNLHSQEPVKKLKL